jgi:hypothetical protein
VLMLTSAIHARTGYWPPKGTNRCGEEPPLLPTPLGLSSGRIFFALANSLSSIEASAGNGCCAAPSSPSAPVVAAAEPPCCCGNLAPHALPLSSSLSSLKAPSLPLLDDELLGEARVAPLPESEGLPSKCAEAASLTSPPNRARRAVASDRASPVMDASVSAILTQQRLVLPSPPPHKGSSWQLALSCVYYA